MTKKKIMIIDDDKEFLDELKETLELSGYDMVAVNDEEQALDIVRETRPALILLDLKMPKKSGFRLANELAYMPDIPRIPIIVMSAYYHDNYNVLLGVYGIKKFLAKPFQPLDVITAIEEILSPNGH